MHTYACHKLLLITLLTSTTFTCKADLPKWATDNATHLLWGAGTACVAGATWLLANSTAKERFAYLENEALRKKESDEKEAENRSRQAIEQKKTADRITIERAHNFLEQLGDLYETYNATPIDQLTRSKDFQQLLLARVLGNNAQPKRLKAFNEKIDNFKSHLFAIDNPKLQSQKALILAQLNWYQQQANNSGLIIGADNELTREHYELEQVRHMKHIAAERAMQEKLQTDSLRKVCTQNEEIAATNAQTSKELRTTAEKMSETFKRQDIHIQGTADRIERTVTEGIHALNAWQAASADERQRIAQTIPMLIKALQACETDNAFIEEKLNTALQNQTRILNLLKEIRDLPDDLKFMAEQAAHHAHQLQPSAPPMDLPQNEYA